MVVFAQIEYLIESFNIVLNISQNYSWLHMSQFAQSDEYAPERCPSLQDGQSSQVYKRRVQKIYENSIEGKWTQEENLKYILYMDYHSKIFVSKEKRKSQRIFKSLSDFLKTRTPRQCRSHFQKIMNKFKNFKKVKQFYQQQLGTEQYHNLFTKIAQQLKSQSVKIEEKEDQNVLTKTGTINAQVQTEPLKICLSDLSNGELIKLMSIFHQYQQTQMPFWLNNSQSSFQTPPTKDNK